MCLQESANAGQSANRTSAAASLADFDMQSNLAETKHNSMHNLNEARPKSQTKPFRGVRLVQQAPANIRSMIKGAYTRPQ
jgi:hypothetical protein